MNGTTVHINSKTYTNVKRIFIGNDAFEYKGTLPDGYSIINGLYSHLGGYINTNFPLQVDDIVKVAFVQSSESASGCFFGVRYAGSYDSDPASHMMINKGLWGSGANRRSYSLIICGEPILPDGVLAPYNPSYLEDVENEVIFDVGNGVYLNGEAVDIPYDYSFTQNSMTYSPYLFANNNQNGNVTTRYDHKSGRLLGYSVERNGEVVVDMVPVKTADDVFGMYDLARDTFFGSANNLAFSNV